MSNIYHPDIHHLRHSSHPDWIQTFITHSCRIRHSSPQTFITSDFHHLRLSSSSRDAHASKYFNLIQMSRWDVTLSQTSREFNKLIYQKSRTCNFSSYGLLSYFMVGNETCQNDKTPNLYTFQNVIPFVFVRQACVMISALEHSFQCLYGWQTIEEHV